MLQTAFNGFVTGIIVTLPALAITLLFGVLKFPNFAVGAMMTLAAYMAFALNVQLGWPLIVATAVAAVAFGGLLIVIDHLTFKPLRERGSITLMVASLGLGFVLENIARLAYGNTARSFAIELARPFRFLDIRMNREQMIIIGVSTLGDARDVRFCSRACRSAARCARWRTIRRWRWCAASRVRASSAGRGSSPACCSRWAAC